MKIRENRLRVLRQMTDATKWYESTELDAELFLLSRMVEEQLLKVRFETVNGVYKSFYKLKESNLVTK